MMIVIVGFNKKYSEQFFMLNKAWIEESWRLEDSDKKDLLNPDKIIEKGGQVFFALENKIAIGTVAMIKSSDDRFELAKMTVKEGFRGKILETQCHYHGYYKRHQHAKGKVNAPAECKFKINIVSLDHLKINTKINN